MWFSFVRFFSLIIMKYCYCRKIKLNFQSFQSKCIQIHQSIYKTNKTMNSAYQNWISSLTQSKLLMFKTYFLHVSFDFFFLRYLFVLQNSLFFSAWMSAVCVCVSRLHSIKQAARIYLVTHLVKLRCIINQKTRKHFLC